MNYTRTLKKIQTLIKKTNEEVIIRTIIKLIRNKGACGGVRCDQCPFWDQVCHTKNNKYSNQERLGLLKRFAEENKELFLDYLI